MSVAQAKWIYKFRQDREYYNAVLSTFPLETQKLWKEFIEIPHWDEVQHKTALKIIALITVAYFFFRRKLISIKKAEKLILEFIEHSNNKYKEFCEKKEIVEVMETFQRNNVKWNQ